MGLKKAKKSKKKLIIWIIIGVAILCTAVFFAVNYFSGEVFTSSEYVKEIILQNSNFEDLIDNFIEEARLIRNSRRTVVESGNRLGETEVKMLNFLNNMEEKLGPKVPHNSKDHYQKMMAVYKKYIEACKAYTNALISEYSQEREEKIESIEKKFVEARQEMQTLK